MPRASQRLSARTAATLLTPGLHADGNGLYLHVTAAGARSWIYRFKRNGRARDMGLGSLNDVGLAEARELAIDSRRIVRQGGDPIEARRSGRMKAKLDAASAMTFRQCAEAFIAAHNASWRSARHAAQWPSSLEVYAYPVFGDLSVNAVDVGLVLKAIEPIWEKKPETASRVRGRIESVLDWATARGYRQGENPARWRGHLENLLPKKSRVKQVKHFAALPYAQIGAFIEELRLQGGIAARALEFTILTAARTGEVLGARWDEINLADGVWTIPAGRMKAGKAHRVALSNAARAISTRWPKSGMVTSCFLARGPAVRSIVRPCCRRFNG